MKLKITCQECGAKAGKVTIIRSGAISSQRVDYKQICKCSPFVTMVTIVTQPEKNNRKRVEARLINLAQMLRIDH